MTTEQIQQLINSLNSIGEIAFRAAIKQMYIDGIFTFIIGMVVFAYVLYIFRAMTRYCAIHANNIDEGMVFAWVILIGGIIISIFFVWASVSNFINPEYGALKSILSSIR